MFVSAVFDLILHYHVVVRAKVLSNKFSIQFNSMWLYYGQQQKFTFITNFIKEISTTNTDSEQTCNAVSSELEGFRMPKLAQITE